MGKLISDWDPHDLELHPAGSASGMRPSVGPEQVLPGYVPRAHDQILTSAVLDAANGHSRMVVLVGSSSTGKTRSCWEAVQPLAAQGWRLWHPVDPTRVHAALGNFDHVLPRTVIWLNEAQHYLGAPRLGEQIAAAVHTLLTNSQRRPVLVLGTLWPEYANLYTALPQPDSPDPHSRVRELLAGRTVTVSETFDQEALHTAAALADRGDWLMADALSRAHDHGRVTQDLAGAPELERRYDHGTPPARAVLEAAMDARRLGVEPHLPLAFLIDAAIDYLSDLDYDALTEDWAEAALSELARPVHGKQAPLRRTRPRPKQRAGGPRPTPAPDPGDTIWFSEPEPEPEPAPMPSSAVGPVFRLADYLEQYGHRVRFELCPPTSFWDAALTHLTHPDDLYALAHAAKVHGLQQDGLFLRRAALCGHAGALSELTTRRLNPDGLVIGTGERNPLGPAARLSRQRDEEQAFAVEALITLALLHEEAGDMDAAEVLRQSVEDPVTVEEMAKRLMGALLAQLQAMRRQTALSVINNLR